MQIESKQSSDSEMHKDGDSVPKITDAEFTEYDGTTDDPPPKDTGQWKAAKKQ